MMEVKAVTLLCVALLADWGSALPGRSPLRCFLQFLVRTFHRSASRLFGVTPFICELYGNGAVSKLQNHDFVQAAGL